MNHYKVAFIYSPELVYHLNKLEPIRTRSNLVISLIQAFQLLKSVAIINPKEATDKQISSFHSNYYIEVLKKLNNDSNVYVDDFSDLGLEYDCPVISGIYDFCKVVAGGSITAANAILSGDYKYAINWFGGWHHAKREKASGYCYVNDIVLCILTLRKRFSRILYIDLDLHHGDGVQEAFESTDNVMTLSFHKYTPGFYPGTGSLSENGVGKGLNYCLNVPLLSGINDQMYTFLYKEIVVKVLKVYEPEVVIVQCGADSLYGDPSAMQSCFNLSSEAYLNCIQLILDTKIPAIFLGGGGYDMAKAACLWTQLTALICNQTHLLNKQPQIPEHEFYLKYSSIDYVLNVNSSRQVRNENSEDYIKNILKTLVDNNLKQIDIQTKFV